MATGNHVAGGSGYSKYDWVASLDVSVVKSTDTTITYRVSLGYGSYYAINSHANGSTNAGGQWYGSLNVNGNGYWQWVSVASNDVELARGNGNAYNHTFTGQINGTGGYGNGTSNVSVTVTVPSRVYYKPHAPKNLKVERLNDTSAKITWDPDYTDMAGGYPWSTVKPAMRTGNGSMVDLQEVPWDTKSYTTNAMAPGGKYTFAARAFGPGGTSDYSNEVVIYTTPNALGMLEAVKTDTGKVALNGHDAPAYVDTWEFQRTSDHGKTWADVTLTSNWEDGAAPAGTIKYRARAVKSGLKGPWTESNEITTICPPLAPAITKILRAYPTGSMLYVTWTPNHPDGSVQSAAQVEITEPGASPKVEDIFGDTTVVTCALYNIGTWKVRVRTKGLDASWGEWSSYVVFTVADAPQAFFVSPAADNDKVIALPVTVKWNVIDTTGIIAQSLRLLNAAGDQLWAVTVAPDTTSFTVGYGQWAFENNTDYIFELTVTGGSSLSTTTRRKFTTEWAAPSEPVANVFINDICGCNVTVFAGEVSETKPVAEKFTISRILADGSTLQLGGELLSGQSANDPLPPLNTHYQYLVTAYADTGAASTAIVDGFVASRGPVLNFRNDAGIGIVAKYMKREPTRKIRHSHTMIHFADAGETGGLPKKYGLTEIDITDKLDIMLVGKDVYTKCQNLAMIYDECWIRDVDGGRFNAAIDCDFKKGKASDIYVVSIDATWQTWEEPINA